MTRNAERTRRAILDSAEELLAQRGTAMSLADVATHAGVSKSGLLHHYSSRDELLLAVVRHVNHKFRSFVTSRVELSENRPGKMLRAYVRALCAGDAATSQFLSSAVMWNGTVHIAGIEDEMADDRRWWDEQLTIDGVNPDAARLVQRAAEGVAAASAFGDETPDSLDRMRDMLIAMADDPANHRH
jgi:AcrR family transcriptional regulator